VFVFQDQWSSVLELATDTTPIVNGSKSSDKLGDVRNANVRRQAMVVVDAVYRNGLVAPWLGVPTLVALTTDPCRCSSTENS
jgi:Sister chromatid cohesion C-terminus